MITNTRFSSLFVVLFVLASSFAVAFRLDGSTWPVSIAPTSSVLYPGDTTTLAVGVNHPGNSPTNVSLSCSHPNLLYVPSSITVPTGNGSVETGIAAMTLPIGVKAKADSRNLGTTVTITASANGRSASTTVTVQ